MNKHISILTLRGFIPQNKFFKTDPVQDSKRSGHRNKQNTCILYE